MRRTQIFFFGDLEKNEVDVWQKQTHKIRRLRHVNFTSERVETPRTFKGVIPSEHARNGPWFVVYEMYKSYQG